MAVKDTISTLTEQQKRSRTRPVGDPMSTYNQYEFPQQEDMQPESVRKTRKMLPAIPSKFQQQMTGEWNERMMRREKFGSQDQKLAGSANSVEGTGSVGVEHLEDGEELDVELTYDDDHYDEDDAQQQQHVDLSKVDLSPMLPRPSSPIIFEVPEELEFHKIPLSPQPTRRFPETIFPAVNATADTFVDQPANASAVLQSGVELLAEIDRDYLRLRQKLVSFLNNNTV